MMKKILSVCAAVLMLLPLQKADAESGPGASDL